MERNLNIYYTLLAVGMLGLELLYFRIADHFNILDKPNLRSSHYKPVVRGGGIIFIFALLFWFFWFGLQWPWFLLGITAAAVISFMDDVRSQEPLTRFLVHLFAVGTIFFTVGLFDWPVWLWLLALVVSIGAMNAFNFMDGINGITGIYALVSLSTFLVINRFFFPFTSESFIVTSIIPVLVFLWFNFRKKAVCFAGDVGSVTIAFILIFLLLQLINSTGNLLWVVLFLVYGIDSVVTIILRLKRRENIFKPHRTHLYQYLCNEFGLPHRTVSMLYGLVQLLLNSVLIYAIVINAFWLAIAIGIVTLASYLATRTVVLSASRTNS